MSATFLVTARAFADALRKDPTQERIETAANLIDDLARMVTEDDGIDHEKNIESVALAVTALEKIRAAVGSAGRQVILRPETVALIAATNKAKQDFIRALKEEPLYRVRERAYCKYYGLETDAERAAAKDAGMLSLMDIDPRWKDLELKVADIAACVRDRDGGQAEDDEPHKCRWCGWLMKSHLELTP